MQPSSAAVVASRPESCHAHEARGATVTLLVTGAGGFVGRRLAALIGDREELLVAHRWSGPAQLSALLGDATPSACIHLGWYADPRDYLVNPTENLASLRSSLELLEELTRRGCRHLVASGTCAEYAPSSQPLREVDRIAPWSVYAAAKHSFATLAASSLADAGPQLAWARIFNVSGPGEHQDRLFPWVVRQVRSGASVPLTDGRQRRDYLDVDDVARALLALSDARAVGTFNVCSGQDVELRAALLRLIDGVGSSRLLQFGACERGPRDQDVVVGTPEALQQATSWAPEHSLDAILDRARTWALSL